MARSRPGIARSALTGISRFTRGLAQDNRHTFSIKRAITDLIARPLPLCYDSLRIEQAFLLYTTLENFLPPDLDRKFRIRSGQPLPPGYHHVFFPTTAKTAFLLPDGTDDRHAPRGSPSSPFSQRLWAGGRIRFGNPNKYLLGSESLILVERIRKVQLRGRQGSEKIFVDIDRQIALPGQDGISEIWSTKAEPPSLEFPDQFIESRSLCFLRDDPQSVSSLAQPRKIIKPPEDPIYEHKLVPTPALLFRFSALTFNAHAIHIDPVYAREVYGAPKLLVHGPLCLTLLLQFLVRKLPAYHPYPSLSTITLQEITYRNLAPLFVNEELRLCAKLKPTSPSPEQNHPPTEEWEVWIETGEGEQRSLAVRGTVTLQRTSRFKFRRLLSGKPKQLLTKVTFKSHAEREPSP